MTDHDTIATETPLEAASCCAAPSRTSEATTITATDDAICCTTSTSVSANAESGALEEIQSQDTPADVAAIRAAAFKHLLDTGTPVTVSDLIAATGVPTARANEIFESVRARGRVEFDDQGRLIGIAGLSLTPSRHELTIGDNTRWTWCALDAVGILGALEATGNVRSTDPQTGEPIEIAFTDGIPDADATLFILGGYSGGNVREEWCPRVNFFNTRQAATRWVSEQGLEGDIVSVAEIAPEAAAMWRPVVDLGAPQVC